MFLPLSTYHPDNQPLGQFKNFPIYLVTVLVAVHVVSMLSGVVIGRQPYVEMLQFAPNTFSPFAQPWRWVTYAFVQVPTVWFLIEMYLLYSFGRQIEGDFGRRVFLRIYAALIILPPLLATVAFLAGVGSSQVFAGSNLSTFCLFMGICLVNPGAPLFGIHWLPLKLVGPLLLGISVLSYLADRDGVGLIVLLSCVLLLYKMLRAYGLPARFGDVKEAFRDALPARKAKPVPTTSHGKTSDGKTSDGKIYPKSAAKPKEASKYYEPKIKPKPDLAPERKAVEEIDGLLDKIARLGLDSLTAEEKAALQRASSKLKDGVD